MTQDFVAIAESSAHSGADVSATELAALPKVALHDHLDGGLRPGTVIELAQQCGYTGLPSENPTELGLWFRDAADSGSLVRYLETFGHTVAVMGTPEALHRVAVEAVLDHAADGVVHAELRYAPELWADAGLSIHEVIEAVNSGVEDGIAQARGRGVEITVGVILCAMRQADRSLEIAEATVRYAGVSPVVGFDIAGPELGFPPSLHEKAFSLLRSAGVPFTVHAGEADGLESIRGALDLGATRIGHGVRIIDDITVDGRPAAETGLTAVQWRELLTSDDSDTTAVERAGGRVRLGALAQRVLGERIPLELCPASNVQTGAAASVARHPVTALLALGFTVCLSTDNRLMSHTSMTAEMEGLAREAGWSRADFDHVTRHAAGAAFLSEDGRADLLARIARS